ncbi:F-box/LRR-repeat protein [Zea mays]|uniref:F-box/LRR-repeat protein n=1 Tax=Zea mays TaxID=4577 RepID=A0A3L6E942_MAIZE|nr:F-box/LRR-repeat protein [Zea mays]
MVIGPDGGSGAKKQRADEQGDGCEAVGADADPIPLDHSSMLPNDLRYLILTHLPLKYAIRTGALSREWHGLWKRRWSHRDPAEGEVHLRRGAGSRRELHKFEQQRRPLPPMDRFSLVVETGLRSSELRRFMRYAADRRVQDLHVETRKSIKKNENLNFHLPLSSPALVRLSLRRINISNMYYRGAQPFRALEVIQLYLVCINVCFAKMMGLCPSLLTLDLRGCVISCGAQRLFVPPTVRNVTVAECGGYSKLWLRLAPNLRSFRYSGDVRSRPFYLPLQATALADLYIRSANRLEGTSQHNADNLRFAIPKNLPGLNVLTICSNALQVASYSLPMPNDGAPFPTRNLRSLRELQLLMLDMEAVNLADLYVFLKTCRCPNLERIFVQLPAFSHVPVKGPIDEVMEEPSQDGYGFDNLVMVKVMNFNWRPTEVQLLGFLLRRASPLCELLIVSNNAMPLNLSGVPDEDLTLLLDGIDNGKITVRKSDDAEIQPCHSEDFIKF